jgi:hypothetical protein
MDKDTETRFDRQDDALGQIAAGVERHGDTLTIVSRQLGEIQRLLTPKPADGESSLERLLAQIVAQGQEQLKLLRGLAAMLGRMNDTPGRGAGREQRENGSEHGAKS